MKRFLSLGGALALAFSMCVANSRGSEPAPQTVASEVNKLCPITGKPANPAITLEYEDVTYAFADETARAKFDQDRQNSLYHKLGGKAAIDAAVDRFYVKILADKRINHFFEDISMKKQIRKQKEFLSAAFGGPVPFVGKDLRKAHANLPGLNETHFNAVAEHLEATLVELKVKRELIDQVMAIAAGARDAVLNRPAPAK